jgi:hypothetical protein
MMDDPKFTPVDSPEPAAPTEAVTAHPENTGPESGTPPTTASDTPPTAGSETAASATPATGAADRPATTGSNTPAAAGFDAPAADGPGTPATPGADTSAAAGPGTPAASADPPAVSPAVEKFKSCRWRVAPEDGEFCTHRDVLPFAGKDGFVADSWCPDCAFYKLRRTPKKRERLDFTY